MLNVLLPTRWLQYLRTFTIKLLLLRYIGCMTVVFDNLEALSMIYDDTGPVITKDFGCNPYFRRSNDRACWNTYAVWTKSSDLSSHPLYKIWTIWRLGKQAGQCTFCFFNIVQLYTHLHVLLLHNLLGFSLFKPRYNFLQLDSHFIIHHVQYNKGNSCVMSTWMSQFCIGKAIVVISILYY